MKNNKFKYCLKVIVIGDQYVGKTSIIKKFVNNEVKQIKQNYEATIGPEYSFQIISMDNKDIIKFDFWDTSGQECFRSITKTYYTTAAIALIVYDMCNKKSFENVKSWINDL